MEMLSSRLEELKHKKRVTEDVLEEAERRNDEVKEQLRSNENFRQISHLEERLADLTEEARTLQSTLEQMKKASVSFECVFVLCSSGIFSRFRNLILRT